mmetsp:Transcript_104789/g.305996  ORF Transcript_104789/g.305996 Transcript_104789/m.305996 type:complete len:460 (-) Transcript_104789:176-1555(-)
MAAAPSECAVCLTATGALGACRHLACGHAVHEACLQELHAIGFSSLCPVCRSAAPRPGHSAEDMCREAAVEYVRAVRCTAPGSAARHVVGERCLALVNGTLDLDGEHSHSWFFLGMLMLRGIGTERDEAAAGSIFQRVHLAGNLHGTVELARMCKLGLGVQGRDEGQARELFAEAAAGGNLHGILELALMCKDGVGGEKDLSMARDLFEQASGRGDVLANYEFGLMLKDGIGGSKDEMRARELMEKAHTGGYSLATYTLADMYISGVGGERDEAMGQSLLFQKDFGAPRLAPPDEASLAQGWMREGGINESYRAELQALADRGQWFQPGEEAAAYKEEPSLGGQPALAGDGVWRAAMSFGSIAYGDPLNVSASQVVTAEGKRAVVDLGDGVSICAELVAPGDLAAFMARTPQGATAGSVAKPPKGPAKSTAFAALKRLAAGMGGALRHPRKPKASPSAP